MYSKITVTDNPATIDYTTLKTGDIIVSYDNTLCWSGHNWDTIATVQPKVEYRELKPKLCSCCGAPLHWNKCEYCGVEYS